MQQMLHLLELLGTALQTYVFIFWSRMFLTAFLLIHIQRQNGLVNSCSSQAEFVWNARQQADPEISDRRSKNENRRVQRIRHWLGVTKVISVKILKPRYVNHHILTISALKSDVVEITLGTHAIMAHFHNGNADYRAARFIVHPPLDLPPQFARTVVCLQQSNHSINIIESYVRKSQNA